MRVRPTLGWDSGPLTETQHSWCAHYCFLSCLPRVREPARHLTEVQVLIGTPRCLAPRRPANVCTKYLDGQKNEFCKGGFLQLNCLKSGKAERYFNDTASSGVRPGSPRPRPLATCLNIWCCSGHQILGLIIQSHLNPAATSTNGKDCWEYTSDQWKGNII